MVKIDLNCDLGESFGAYTIGMDDKVIPLISSCNIACGYHASDPLVMQKTVAMAAGAGIGIGAHPGYPDLMGFCVCHVSAGSALRVCQGGRRAPAARQTPWRALQHGRERL